MARERWTYHITQACSIIPGDHFIFPQRAKSHGSTLVAKAAMKPCTPRNARDHPAGCEAWCTLRAHCRWCKCSQCSRCTMAGALSLGMAVTPGLASTTRVPRLTSSAARSNRTLPSCTSQHLLLTPLLGAWKPIEPASRCAAHCASQCAAFRRATHRTMRFVPTHCRLPRVSPLQLRGRKILFAGDSIMRYQFDELLAWLRRQARSRPISPSSSSPNPS